MEYYLIFGVAKHLLCSEFSMTLLMIDETFSGLTLPFVAIGSNGVTVEFPNGRSVGLNYLDYQKLKNE
jgi:hypothetical protein